MGSEVLTPVTLPRVLGDVPAVHSQGRATLRTTGTGHRGDSPG